MNLMTYESNQTVTYGFRNGVAGSQAEQDCQNLDFDHFGKREVKKNNRAYASSIRMV